MSHSLLHHNTFGLSVTCNELLEYESISHLCTILPKIRQSKWLHIGKGSNLLFLNDHYAGIVLHSTIKGMEILSDDADFSTIRVGAGEEWDDFVHSCIKQGLYGLENLSLIPGEVGSSAVQNIGAYGVEVGSLIESVETVEIATGEIKIFTRSECEYDYRSSVFKHRLRNQYIVTHVIYRLSHHFRPTLSHAAILSFFEQKGVATDQIKPMDLRNAVIEIRQSKLPDFREYGNAGSFFMNPVIPKEQARILLEKHPAMPHYAMPDGVKIPAGWLIEQCGWKNRKTAVAGVHEKQALVLINLGNATGKDIAFLAEEIQKDVRKKFGISIIPEVLYIE
ncbi:UDP-N-acetylmuramate dehydrogenase [Alloprevotella sp. OH1205_COT-284]|uniref:UDP-N-acetylmuramate dehydrogenase n=1 Tax=Alloprevotella sp. OH1205_COT-284 TaxID=2491043 RepID=UPI000F5F2274|nr:UDP-N-acetylmuramate dehydrogenase [Alloprevotella sp. OH1205_COT-284]RRD78502.1 UDP-N-acetylmuramate dehydrogenase [Alloprevotella sp. OH1205_COT-284]